MIVIEILQKVKGDAEGLLLQLNSGASRLYEISTTGTIVERTTEMRQYYQDIGQQLQQAINLLRK